MGRMLILHIPVYLAVVNEINQSFFNIIDGFFWDRFSSSWRTPSPYPTINEQARKSLFENKYNLSEEHVLCNK